MFFSVPSESVPFLDGQSSAIKWLDWRIGTLELCFRPGIMVFEPHTFCFTRCQGRMNFNHESNRLELVCSHAGVPFVSATSEHALNDLGDYRSPNTSSIPFALGTIWILQYSQCRSRDSTVGVTRLDMYHHSLFDGKTAAESMLTGHVSEQETHLKSSLPLKNTLSCQIYLHSALLLLHRHHTCMLIIFTPEMLSTLED